MVIIRPVTPADRLAWERMRANLWPGDDHAADIAAFFSGARREPEAVLVAELPTREQVAFVELSIRQDLAETGGAPTGYVEGLYVKPAHRASGLARRLLRAAQQWARERRCAFFAADRDDRIVVDRSYRVGTAGATPHLP